MKNPHSWQGTAALNGDHKNDTSHTTFYYTLSPCKTAEYIQSSVFPTVKVHAQDSGKNQQNHSKVEDYHNCCLDINHRRSDVITKLHVEFYKA